MTDRLRLPDPALAIRHLPRGSAVIVRDHNDASRATLARRIRRLCRERGMRLLIANDARLARTIDADGLHLSEASVRRASRRWGATHRAGWLITGAAHSPSALRRAARLGVDAVLLSPVFATQSHPNAPSIGPLRFARWVRESPVPVYALGGIDARTARRLRNSGAMGFAAISGLFPPSQSASVLSR